MLQSKNSHVILTIIFLIFRVLTYANPNNGYTDLYNWISLAQENTLKEYRLSHRIIEDEAGISDRDIALSFRITNSVFKRSLELSRVDFTSNFEAYNNEFNDNVLISMSSFNSTAQFLRSQFRGDLIFTYVNFENAAFLNDSFNTAKFYDCRFRGNLSFKSSHFTNTLTIVNPNGLQAIDFSRARLPDTLHLIDIKRCSIDLTAADFSDSNKIHYLNLYNTDISNVRFNYLNFKLIFVDRDGQQLNSEEAESIFLAALNNFKKSGHLKSYEILNKHYRDYKLSLLKPIDRYFAEYISSPYWVIKFTIFFLLLFSILNIFFLEKLNSTVFTITHFKEDYPDLNDKSIFHIIALKFFYSLIYTSIVYFSFKFDSARVRFYNRWLLIWFAIIYSLGCINLFLIANLLFRE